MKLKSLLSEIYAPFDNQWVKRNGIIFDQARVHGLAVAGSIAIAVGRKKAIKPPGDIDLVAPDFATARKFLTAIEDFLLQRTVYWKVQINSKTAFCPKGCPIHIRLNAPFWLPVCIMVIGEMRYYRTEGGNMVQQFDDVVKAAKELDERDGKGRVDFMVLVDSVTDEEPPSGQGAKAPKAAYIRDEF